MQASFNPVYTAAAALRILSVSVKNASAKVQEWFSVVWVHIPGSRPRFMSKAAFKKNFVEQRKAAARALAVFAHPLSKGTYGVRNETKGTSYTVTTTPTAIACNCPDYRNQIEAFGKGVCKHGYAVLSVLNCGSLAEYLSKQNTPVERRSSRPETFRGKSID